jgi:hypothetical protein
LEWNVPVEVDGVVVDGVVEAAAVVAALVDADVAACVMMKLPAKAPPISPRAVAATAARRGMPPKG